MPYPITHVSKHVIYIGTFIAGLVIGAVIVYGSVYVSDSRLRNALAYQTESQLAVVTTIAEVTDRNGADEVVSEVVRDCIQTERRRFDELLAKLTESIRRTELLELQSLFAVCGDYYAVQKSSMVSRFAREVEQLETYVSLQSVNNRLSPFATRIDDWNRLVELEREQAKTFLTMVDLQREIIESLVAGRSLQSTELQAVLTDVRSVQSEQELLNIEIDTLRASLTTS